MSEEEFNGFIDDLIDAGAVDNNDVLMSKIDQLPEDQKLKVMDEIEAIRNELDDSDIVASAHNNDLDSLDAVLDRKASRKDYRDTAFDNPVDEQAEIDNDNDGDADLTITKQDDGNDNEPTENTKDNSSEEGDMPNADGDGDGDGYDPDVSAILHKMAESYEKPKGSGSQLSSNVINAVTEHRF